MTDLATDRTDRIIEGMTLIRKHGLADTNATHDEICCGLSTNQKLSDADHLHMTSREEDGGLGWHWNDEYECYCIFT